MQQGLARKHPCICLHPAPSLCPVPDVCHRGARNARPCSEPSPGIHDPALVVASIGLQGIHDSPDCAPRFGHQIQLPVSHTRLRGLKTVLLQLGSGRVSLSGWPLWSSALINRVSTFFRRRSLSLATRFSRRTFYGWPWSHSGKSLR